MKVDYDELKTYIVNLRAIFKKLKRFNKKVKWG